jgi:hypothetical protein
MLMEDNSGGLFDSISWLLMNSGSIDLADGMGAESPSLMKLTGSMDSMEHAFGSLPHTSSKGGSMDFHSGLSVACTPITPFPVPTINPTRVKEVVVVSEAMGGSDDDSFDGFDGMVEDTDKSIAKNCTPNDKKRKRDLHISPPTKGGSGAASITGPITGLTSPQKSPGLMGMSAAGIGAGGSKDKRKRLREGVDDLESKLKALQEENSELRSHLTDMTQRALQMEQQKAEIQKLMNDKVSQIGGDAHDTEQNDISNLWTRYKDVFSDHGSSRQKEVAFHLNQLKKLLIPTQTTKMCLWTLQQDKSFYQSNKSPLFSILSNELGLNDDQTTRIQSHRQRVLVLLERLQESLQLTENLQDTIHKSQSLYENRCGRFYSILTPKQCVHYLTWIESNLAELGKVIPNFRTVSYLADNSPRQSSTTAACNVPNSSSKSPNIVSANSSASR